MEPVWAAAFGALAGERMGLGALAGAALILASMAVGRVQEEAQHLA
jgi:drug/metabolite transporter (DMT)-like permease